VLAEHHRERNSGVFRVSEILVEFVGEPMATAGELIPLDLGNVTGWASSIIGKL